MFPIHFYMANEKQQQLYTKLHTKIDLIHFEFTEQDFSQGVIKKKNVELEMSFIKTFASLCSLFRLV